MTTDLVCFDDITLMADETTDDLVQLEQDIYHTVIENRGENLDDPNGGFGLDDLLSSGAGVKDSRIPALQHQLQATVSRDARVKSVGATIAQTGGFGNEPSEYTINLDIDSDAGHLKSSFTTPTGGNSGGA